MFTNPYRKSSIWKSVAVLLLVLMLVSSSRVTNTSASPMQDIPSPTDLIRQDMHNIAYLYANHAWSASWRNFITYYQGQTDPYPLRFATSDPDSPVLEFDGAEKYFDNISGHFTIKNLYSTPLDTGVPAISAKTLLTTNSYSYLLFQ